MTSSDAYDQSMTMAAELSRRYFPEVAFLSDSDRLRRVIAHMEHTTQAAVCYPANRPLVDLAHAYAIVLPELNIVAAGRFPF